MQGRMVSGMRLVSSSGVALPQKLLGLLEQKSGEALDRVKLRDSVRRLYATGRFADVEVNGEEGAEGHLLLTFVTSPNYFNGSLRVVGLPKGAPTASQMLHAARLSLGELFTEQKLTDSVERMTHLLEQNGRFRARVSTERIPHPETQQMDLIFHVTPGELARLGTIAVTGDSGLTAEQVQRIAGLRPGSVVREDVVTRTLARLRKAMSRQSRLEARLSAGPPVYHASTNTVDFAFHIVRGPVIDIRSEGASLSAGKLRKYVPVFEENAVDEDLLNEGRRNLRDYLQTRGYYDASITVRRTSQGPDNVSIVFQIDHGERRKLTGIDIQGNRSFTADDIRQLLVMQPGSSMLRNGRFSNSILARDIETVHNLYVSNGYPQAQVTAETVRTGGVKGNDFRAVLTVQEGPLHKVHTLTITGNHVFSEKQIRDRIDLAAGQPYSENTVAGDRDAVTSAYFNAGYAEVEMEATARPLPEDPTQIDVIYAIREGEKVSVDRVLLSGVEMTKPHVVQHEIKLASGQPLSQSHMLESQRRLYDLGIFNEVDLAVQNPDGEVPDKNVLFQLTEARRYTFNWGVGLEAGNGVNQAKNSGPQGQVGVSPRVEFDVTRINFRGRDQSIIFKSHVGNLQKRALLSFDEPRWFDLPNWRLTLTAFYDNTRDVTTFASERLEGSVQLQEVITRSTQLLYSFAYRRVKVDPNSFPAGFSAALIPLYSQPVRVGMPSVAVVRDTRDNPVNSTKGTFNTGDVGIASGAFGSEANFSRISFQNSSYYGFGKKRTFVLARSTRLGFESPYSKFTFVPLPERFFLGGANSLRGFPINQAGPRDPDTGSPLGGNAMFANNLELRLPPMQLPYAQDNLSLVFFHDMGNVFDNSRDMLKNLTTWQQPNRASCRDLSAAASCNFNYISHDVGVGVRYRTPIGPVRIDVGYNLNSTQFPVKQPSNGAAPYFTTVRRLNFFFSLGQTF